MCDVQGGYGQAPPNRHGQPGAYGQQPQGYGQPPAYQPAGAAGYGAPQHSYGGAPGQQPGMCLLLLTEVISTQFPRIYLFY